jgi:hypothetical protein
MHGNTAVQNAWSELSDQLGPFSFLLWVLVAVAFVLTATLLLAWSNKRLGFNVIRIVRPAEDEEI